MSERTPLIQTVVVTQREPRYPHSTLRRLCTVLLALLLIAVLIAFLLPFVIFRHRHFHEPWRHWHSSSARPSSSGISFDELQAILLNTPDPSRIRSSSQYYGTTPSLCGKNISQAVWTRNKWEESGISSNIITYDAYLNYPVGHRLALLKDNEVEYECSLEEDIIDEDSTTGSEDRIPTFHGYSTSGNVTAPYVFVNFGTYWDFEDLVKANVSLKGKIALAKYGRNFRALKIERAQQLGMVGVVMYSDPQEDGEITEENGYKPYPDGPARHPSAVQRGSTHFGYLQPGDPTTPGWPSIPGAPRADPKPILPAIPAIPISQRDALPLLKALNGHGPDASHFNKYWQGGGLAYKGVDYNIGPTPDTVTLNLFNDQEYVTTPIWDVIGIINGTIADEVVVLGNHRDAWIIGGAADPHSGSAVMVEVVEAFGQALAAGWKPLRTIVFASWDGEEYGLLGSTEWVEEYLPWLSSSAVAYFNVDVGTQGTEFVTSASPMLNKLIRHITSVIPSPEGGSVVGHWSGDIGPLGYGSDHVAFLDHTGISSVNFGFGRRDTDPVYMYHSNYDSFYWMDKFGDAKWEYHITMTKMWALMAATMCETPVLSFNATDYAVSLGGYLDSIKDKAKKASGSTATTRFNFQNLDRATERLHKASVKFDAYSASLGAQLHDDVPWWQFWKRARIYVDIRQVNKIYMQLERAFLYPDGLDGRNWYKHVVFAPGRWTGYSGATYPGLVESIDNRNWTNVERWSGIIEERLASAAALLE